VLDLGSHLLESILSLIEQTEDRDSCFRVCQAFRDAERQTRGRRMRLRCTKSQIEQVPMSACFLAVRMLDISSVLPRQAHLSYSPSQLEHLGRCFPNVRELTIFCDGCHTWFSSGKVPFQAVWPKLETIVALEPTANHDPDDVEDLDPEVDLGLAPLASSIHISTDNTYGVKGPLVVTNMSKMGSGSRRLNGLHLKEVHLNGVDKAVLDELAEMDVSGLETLEVEIDREEAFPFHLELLSVGSFQSLHTLTISKTGWVKTLDPPGFVFTDANTAFLLSGLPRLTALSLDLIAFLDCELTTLPFSQSVAENLRKLEVRISTGRQPCRFNFRPIGASLWSTCRS
jgi:hypothetical protein